MDGGSLLATLLPVIETSNPLLASVPDEMFRCVLHDTLPLLLSGAGYEGVVQVRLLYRESHGDTRTAGVRIGGLDWSGIPIQIQMGLEGDRWWFLLPIPAQRAGYEIQQALLKGARELMRMHPEFFLLGQTPRGETSQTPKRHIKKDDWRVIEPTSCPIVGRQWLKGAYVTATAKLLAHAAALFARAPFCKIKLLEAVAEKQPEIPGPDSVLFYAWKQGHLKYTQPKARYQRVGTNLLVVTERGRTYLDGYLTPLLSQ